MFSKVVPGTHSISHTRSEFPAEDRRESVVFGLTNMSSIPSVGDPAGRNNRRGSTVSTTRAARLKGVTRIGSNRDRHDRVAMGVCRKLKSFRKRQLIVGVERRRMASGAARLIDTLCPEAASASNLLGLGGG